MHHRKHKRDSEVNATIIECVYEKLAICQILFIAGMYLSKLS